MNSKTYKVFNLCSISSGGGFDFSVDFVRPVTKTDNNKIIK